MVAASEPNNRRADRMKESTILKTVMLAATLSGAVAFRNNVGQGWMGRTKWLKSGDRYVAHGDEIVIQQPRPLHAGLHTGSADLIGWRTIEITPDMVGKRVAVFLSAETKSATGRLSLDQKNWLHQVHGAGGVGIVCRSADEFTELLSNYSPK